MNKIFNYRIKKDYEDFQKYRPLNPICRPINENNLKNLELEFLDLLILPLMVENLK